MAAVEAREVILLAVLHLALDAFVACVLACSNALSARLVGVRIGVHAVEVETERVAVVLVKSNKAVSSVRRSYSSIKPSVAHFGV